MKQYLITGGTGLIGSALCRRLIENGDQVIVLSRSLEKVRERCGYDVVGVESLDNIDKQLTIDLVINLAGEPIADRRWTIERKAVLEQSRIQLTQSLIQWIFQRSSKPECLISGSAVGWYGDQEDNIVTEQSGFKDEYTHELCQLWEQQALRAGQLGIRVCILRTGLVLAKHGGFLAKMKLPFQLGLGGKIGSGKQYMPWIHIEDMLDIIQFLADNEQMKGVYNACSPFPVTNQQFAQALAQQLHRPAIFPMPSAILKTLLGEMSQLLLTGQRALPANLQANGFTFNYTDIDTALADVLHTNR